MRPLFALSYFLLLAFHLYAGEWAGDHSTYADAWQYAAWGSKPLLLISLIVYFLSSGRNMAPFSFDFWILLALLFSLGGDVALIFQRISSAYFILGLGSFLLAHLAYSAAFAKNVLTRPLRDTRSRHQLAHIWGPVVILGIAIAFYLKLYPHLLSMSIPVACYTAAIATMVILALKRSGRVTPASFLPIAIGAFCFFASDAVLAWNKFVSPVALSHFWIMLSYGAAQFFIVWGALQYKIDPIR